MPFDGKLDAKRAAKRKRRADYYAANRDKVKAEVASYYAANRGKINAQRAEYYAANRDEISSRRAKYRAANRDKLAAKDASYYAANRDKVNAAHKARRVKRNELLAGSVKPRACKIEGCTGTKMVWDHCHARQAFRGWICSSCNVALGCVADDPAKLRALADYLEQAPARMDERAEAWRIENLPDDPEHGL